jgi:hypothetical protein
MAALAAMDSAMVMTAAPGGAANSVSAGEFTVEWTTPISAGFHWFITGDDNHNAKVDVQYRRTDDADYRRAGLHKEILGRMLG